MIAPLIVRETINVSRNLLKWLPPVLTALYHDALLTLAIPITLEEDVLDFLLLHPAWAGGFSVMDAQGMGQGAVLQSSMERVQGRSTRKLVLIAGHEVHLRLLLQALALEIRNPSVAYWISPVSGYGRLA